MGSCGYEEELAMSRRRSPRRSRGRSYRRSRGRSYRRSRGRFRSKCVKPNLDGFREAQKIALSKKGRGKKAPGMFFKGCEGGYVPAPADKYPNLRNPYVYKKKMKKKASRIMKLRCDVSSSKRDKVKCEEVKKRSKSSKKSTTTASRKLRPSTTRKKRTKQSRKWR